jgi:hypothetical protein
VRLHAVAEGWHGQEGAVRKDRHDLLHEK